jgi:hypothetical protein
MVINGHVYSILRIIKNICNEYAQLNAFDESANMPVKLHFKGVSNNWVNETTEAPNMVDAIKRSQMIKETIDKFTLAASFDYSILAKYAY